MDLSRRKINKWGKGGEENIIRAKASAEKREKLCVEMSPALPSHVKATQEIRTNLPTKQKAAEPEPQERLRCNSPLRSERHLFPSNGSISGFEKVIWKTRARTHTFMHNTKYGSESLWLFLVYEESERLLCYRKNKKSYCDVQKGQTRLFQIRTWLSPFLLTFNFASR